ncbi:MAG: hypothetical protein IPK44_06245 [Candidatus Accumulibacter sp.]|uniref:hypothetical protein n=1 Tax=Accumulibacter sp. TaxID=2053492 RepID=UPI00258B8ECB|nr:hypothetical protein [Accumulibacter sp.]MBK8114159.1 hypothetical protein [Accumulibacter sp.]
MESRAGGLLLLGELAGATRAIIVDALLDSRRTPGGVVVAGIHGSSQNAACGHDCTACNSADHWPRHGPGSARRHECSRGGGGG